MKNVLIIHTGGTFGMTPADPEQTLKPGKIEQSLDQYVPDVYKIANISIEIPFNLDSSNIGPQEWIKIYNIINMAMDAYDGFVIIHGTDSLVYTASALSYLLHDLKKPVILTGSQRPLSALRTDARVNLINAIELSIYDIPEVAICFGNKLFRGNRAIKYSIERFQSFNSPNYPPLATIGLNLTLHEHYILKQKERIELSARFESDIQTIKIFPGLEPKPFRVLIKQSSRALILEGLGAGHLPAVTDDWIDLIINLNKNNILVFMVSQSPHGSVNLHLYESGRKAESAGVISLRDMTIEAALVKLMLLTGNFDSQTKVAELMQTSLSGEISV
jgi:L-asparaginase